MANVITGNGADNTVISGTTGTVKVNTGGGDDTLVDNGANITANLGGDNDVYNYAVKLNLSSTDSIDGNGGWDSVVVDLTNGKGVSIDHAVEFRAAFSDAWKQYTTFAALHAGLDFNFSKAVSDYLTSHYGSNFGYTASLTIRNFESLKIIGGEAPAAPIISLAHDTGSAKDDLITNDASLNITNPVPDATLQYSFDGGQNWTVDYKPVDGIVNVMARHVDAYGNASAASNVVTFTLDTVAPDAPGVGLAIDTAKEGDLITSIGVLNITNIEPNAAVQYSTDNGKTWTDDFKAQEGTNYVLVHQTDVAGNISSAAAFTFTLDTHAEAPAVAITTDTGTVGDNISSIGLLTVTGEEGAIVEYSTDGGKTWGTDFSATKEGTYDVLVRQTDLAGNVSDPAGFKFTVDTTHPTATIAMD
jgi:hypothetical protein